MHEKFCPKSTSNILKLGLTATAAALNMKTTQTHQQKGPDGLK